MAVHNSFQRSLLNQNVSALAILHCWGFETRRLSSIYDPCMSQDMGKISLK